MEAFLVFSAAVLISGSLFIVRLKKVEILNSKVRATNLAISRYKEAYGNTLHGREFLRALADESGSNSPELSPTQITRIGNRLEGGDFSGAAGIIVKKAVIHAAMTAAKALWRRGKSKQLEQEEKPESQQLKEDVITNYIGEVAESQRTTKELAFFAVIFLITGVGVSIWLVIS